MFCFPKSRKLFLSFIACSEWVKHNFMSKTETFAFLPDFSKMRKPVMSILILWQSNYMCFKLHKNRFIVTGHNWRHWLFYRRSWLERCILKYDQTGLNNWGWLCRANKKPVGKTSLVPCLHGSFTRFLMYSSKRILLSDMPRNLKIFCDLKKRGSHPIHILPA